MNILNVFIRSDPNLWQVLGEPCFLNLLNFELGFMRNWYQQVVIFIDVNVFLYCTVIHSTPLHFTLPYFTLFFLNFTLLYFTLLYFTLLLLCFAPLPFALLRFNIFTLL